MSADRRLMVRIGLECAIVFGLIVLIAYLTNWNLGYFGTILLAPTIVLAWQVQRHLQEPDSGPKPGPRPVAVSMAFRRFQVLRERVRWGMTSSEYFETAVRPLIVELVNDRMLRHHGIDRTRQAGDVDAELERVLGELATLRSGELPAVEALTRSVTRLEEL